MFNAFIIHGSYGNPKSNWFPWLKIQLEKLGIRVYVPEFPINEGQNLQNWLSAFSSCLPLLGKDSIMVGHSIGPAFIFNVLERIDARIRSAFLVAPFVKGLEIEKYDKVNKSFTENEFDWAKIKERCGRFYVYSSDNDPYVPMNEGTYISNKLNAKYTLIKSGGHLNSDSGFSEFPLLLDDIKKELALKS